MSICPPILSALPTWHAVVGDIIVDLSSLSWVWIEKLSATSFEQALLYVVEYGDSPGDTTFNIIITAQPRYTRALKTSRYDRHSYTNECHDMLPSALET